MTMTVTMPLHDLLDRADTLDRIDSLLDEVVDRLSGVATPRDLAPLYSMLKEVSLLFRSIESVH